MPSVSPAQHRWIGYIHSHPEARPKSMSASQVNEWLHADKGSPWKRDAGGANFPTMPPQYSMQSQSPVVQSIFQQYSKMPAEQLQRLAVAMPPNSPRGQMIQMALRAKQMAPASNNAFPSMATQGAPPAPAAPAAPQAPSASPAPQPQQTQGYDSGGGVTYILSPGYNVPIPQLSNSSSSLDPSTAMTGPTYAPPPTSSFPTPYSTALPPSEITPQSAMDVNNEFPNIQTTTQQQGGNQSGANIANIAGLGLQGAGILGQILRRGGVAHRAMGGMNFMSPSAEMPWFVRSAARQMDRPQEMYHPGGFINSAGAGRHDSLPLSVPADSHVIPADVVSGLGQGNSLHGAGMLDSMFHSGPWGTKAIQSHSAIKMPKARPPRPPHFARGGEPTTSIDAAGGEYIVRPEAVAEKGRVAKAAGYHRSKSDMDAGHDVIDKFIVSARRHIVKTMKRLPGPVKG